MTLKLSFISSGQLNMSPCLHFHPINLIVYKEFQGVLILKEASRLDAFSGYPFRT